MLWRKISNPPNWRAASRQDKQLKLAHDFKFAVYRKRGQLVATPTLLFKRLL
ncbi:MAG: hypothetical protein H6507_09550 [Calditrichaeota bacterium]|nr:hypothetical protein [Calditrichota bacterium]